MNELRVGVAALLLATVLVGLMAVARGPTLADRVLVTQLFGTTGVAVLLLLASIPRYSSLRDIAVVFALFAAITVVAFSRVPPDGGGAS